MIVSLKCSIASIIAARMLHVKVLALEIKLTVLTVGWQQIQNRHFFTFLACPCFGECYDGCDDCDHPICGGTNSCKNLELYLDYQVCKSIESEILGDCVTDCAGRFWDSFCDPYGASDIRPIRNLFKDDIYCVLQCDEDFIEGMMECPCQANCPDGCPCPNYICENDDRFSQTEVLLIYQRPSENQPYPPNLINAPLSQVTEINFTWPRNINLYSACMANLNGEPHIFGGYPDTAHRSQVS